MTAATRPRSRERGVGLVEVLIALALVGLGAVSIAQSMVSGVLTSGTAEQLTLMYTGASDLIERLRVLPPSQVTAGGSVETDVAGYFDAYDADLDGNAETARRWQVIDHGDYREFRVAARPLNGIFANARGVYFVTNVAKN